MEALSDTLLAFPSLVNRIPQAPLTSPQAAMTSAERQPCRFNRRRRDRRPDALATPNRMLQLFRPDPNQTESDMRLDEREPTV